MCWSGEASATLAVIGFTSTGYLLYKGESKALAAGMGYFTLMEALQAYTYSVVDECMSTQNNVATLLGYLHICFQPFVINMVILHFMPIEVRQRLVKPVLGLCLVAGGIFVARLIHWDGAGYCYDTGWDYKAIGLDYWTPIPFCGEKTCAYTGEWHIAWQIPANGVWWMSQAYLCAAFIMPLFYGAWRIVLFHYLLGPGLATLATNDINEWAAIWCLYSTTLCFIVIYTPARNFCYVKSWYGISFDRILGKPSSKTTPELSNTE